jgi:hypothetical protein
MSTVPPPPGAPVGYTMVPAGRVPERLGGAFYSRGLVILLQIVTLGIWGALWTYRTNEDMKRYKGDGMGGTIGVLLYVLQYVSIPSVIALFFTIPSEIKAMYEREGRQSPISAAWGWWFLGALIIVGPLIWYLKVQRVLNEFWLSKGAQPG